MTLEAPPEDQDILRVGQVIGDKWEVARLIGRGGMSAVYAANDDNGSAVAIKVLNSAFARQSRARERFLREGLVANSVGHPDTVRVFDSLQTPEGRLLLVMELLEGQTLRKRCEAAGGRLELDEVLSIADRVLRVLEAAHSKGIFHRDIKPDNIFLTTDGGVKVLDFGVAAVRDEASQDASITQSGTTLGTPAFMAPEQARGRQAQVDRRTDVWALGATLFFCLTGRRVHEGAVTANEALIFAATQRAPPLSRFCPNLANSIGPIIDRALAFAPDERWATAEAMRESIAALCLQTGASTSTVIQDDTLASTLADQTPQAHRWLRWPAVVALAAMLLVGAATALPRRGQVYHPAPRLEALGRSATSPPALQPTARQTQESPEPPTSAVPVASPGRPLAPLARTTPAARTRVLSAPASSVKRERADEVPEALLDRRK